MRDKVKNIIIMGAAGRDFHNFNMVFRDNPLYRVVAFTATQIPEISNRIYPPSLAGSLYPQGIAIYDEEEIVRLIKDFNVEEVYFSYSDVSHIYVMHRASKILSAGANFCLLGWKQTMLKSRKKIVSVCAVRTGCGKSPTTSYIAKTLKDSGLNIVVIRHPMPYGDLNKQICQRFSSFEDMDKMGCTIEEREEYERHIEMGIIVFAGIDYKKILKTAEETADVILWDGGNNDLPFIRPDLHIVVVDPHRPNHERLYYPGETNLYMADVIVINKVDSASKKNIEIVKKNIKEVNPSAKIIFAESEIILEGDKINGKKVVIVEDGPTLTHGEMSYGAGTIAAKRFGAKEIVNPKKYAVGSIVEVYKKYPHIGAVIPAMGYYPEQISEIKEIINRIPAEIVLAGTPINLKRILNVNKPVVRVKYSLKIRSGPSFEDLMRDYL